MHDALIRDYLEAILDAIALIEFRFDKIKNANDFVKSPEGVTLLDSISMRLQVIGETTKKIEKKDPEILKKETGVEWDKIMRLRDIISHHYNTIDYEIVYDICTNHIKPLKLVIEKIIEKAS